MSYNISRKRRIEQLKIQRKIIEFLKINFVSKRDDIVKAVQKPRSTVYDNLYKNNYSLYKLGLVDKTEVKLNKSKGRPITLWYLTTEMKMVIAIFRKLNLNYRSK